MTSWRGWGNERTQDESLEVKEDLEGLLRGFLTLDYVGGRHDGYGERD